MSEIVKAVDVSHWQSWMPWHALDQNGWKYAYIKMDEKAVEHTSKARAGGFKRLGLYQWVDPTLSVDYNVDKVLRYLSEIRVESVVMDIEHWWASWSEWWAAVEGRAPWSSVRRLSGQHISDHAHAVVQELIPRINMPLFNYCGRWFINAYSPQLDDWIHDYPYINADYSGAPEGRTLTWEQIDQVARNIGPSPHMPPGKTEMMRQFASKITVKEENVSFDMNVFFGSLEDFDRILAFDPDAEPPEEPLYEAVNRGYFIPIFRLPSKRGGIAGGIRHGQEFEVFEEIEGWTRIGKNQWIPAQPYKDIQKVLYDGVVTAVSLNVRKGPGTNYSTDGWLEKGAQVKIYREVGLWGQIDEDRWVSLNWIDRK
jgi:hypothetical protein